MKSSRSVKNFAVGIVSVALLSAFGFVTPAHASVSTSDSSEVQISSLCPFIDPSVPVELTYEQLVIAQSVLEEFDVELIAALEQANFSYKIIGPRPRALPALSVVASAATAVVAWCVKGALSSIPASAIQHMAHKALQDNVPPPDYVMNAIFGCAGGPVIGALTSQWMRVKFAGAVLSVLMRIR